jgi:hypothetical protein
VIILFKLQLTNIEFTFSTQFANYPPLIHHQLGKKTAKYFCFLLIFFPLYYKIPSPSQVLAEEI